MTRQPEDLEALHEALQHAFPTRSALAQLAYFQLGVNLEKIASPSGLSQTVFDLITWADSQGRLDALVQGARKANPGNPSLIAVAARFGVAAPAAPGSGSAPAGNDAALGVPVDARTLRRSLREVLSMLYPSAIDAQRVAVDIGLRRSRVDFSGAAATVWFNVIEEASRCDLLGALVSLALQEYPSNVTLQGLRGAVVNEGSRESVTASSSGAGGTSGVDAVDLLDRLQRLLPAQFEEVLFRVNAPVTVLSPTTVPLSTRAIELVRLLQQRDGGLGRLLVAIDVVQKRR